MPGWLTWHGACSWAAHLQADDYDDAEYGEAAEAVFRAADRLAQHCQTG